MGAREPSCALAAPIHPVADDVGVKTDVLVVGDANPDLILRGDVRPRFGQAEQLLDSAELTLGGSAALVAHGLARLGVSVSLCAAVGADAYGDFVRDYLTSAGVDCGQLQTVDEATGLSVILSAGDRAILTHLGAINSLRPQHLPDPSNYTHVHAASVYLVSGTRKHLADYVRRFQSSSLDTNDDPAGQWADLAPLLGAVDVALPNESELGRWAHSLGCEPGSWQEHARCVAQLGATVAIKRGADGGAVVRRDQEPIEFPAPPITPIDTTGAGDTFDAGFIAGLLDGRSLDEALAWAVRAGAASTQAAGGAPAQPTRDRLAH